MYKKKICVQKIKPVFKKNSMSKKFKVRKKTLDA